MTAGRPGEMNLKQVASALGVHYMTAYRYVRTGRLAAHRVGTAWVVDPEAVEMFRAHREDPRPQGVAGDPGGSRPDPVAVWRDRLRSTLAVGDETAAWRVLEQALTAGHSPAECYLDLVVGAIDEISGRRAMPEAPVAEEYLATATAARLVARLGARFRRPGRDRGTVVFGAPLGEYHTLPISVVADLVRLEGFNCLELGANVPPEAFAGAAADAYRLIAVGIGVTTATSLAAVRAAADAVHEVDPAIPVVVGGQAASKPGIAAQTNADAFALDGSHAVEVVTGLARSRRRLWLVGQGEDLVEPPAAV